MPLAQTIVDAIARLNDKYNGNNYNVSTNPGGMAADGHRVNFVPALQDVAVVGEAIGTLADEVEAGRTQVVENLGLSNQAVTDAQGQVTLAGEKVDDAAAQVTLAAEQVTLAGQEADRSRDEADRAQGYADGLNLPAITVADAGKALVANAEGTGYLTADLSAPKASQVEAEAGETNDVYMTPLRTAEAIDALTPPGAFEAALLHVRDEKPSGTRGGTPTSATWNVRTLNTVKTNKISAVVSSNQITLLAGEYWIEAVAPLYSSIQRNRLDLYNVTDGVQILVGGSGYNNASTTVVYSHLTGRFTVAAGKALSIRHYVSSGPADGLGYDTSTGFPEVYTDVKIWKVA